MFFLLFWWFLPLAFLGGRKGGVGARPCPLPRPLALLSSLLVLGLLGFGVVVPRPLRPGRAPLVSHRPLTSIALIFLLTDKYSI